MTSPHDAPSDKKNTSQAPTQTPETPLSSSTLTKQSLTRVGIISLFLFVILLIIFLFFFHINKASVDKLAFTYNNVQFTKARHGYDLTFYVNEAQYPTVMNIRNDPRTLENISIALEDVRPLIEGKQQIYITIDPNANLTGKTTVAASEIDVYIDNPYLYDIPVHSAFIDYYAKQPETNQIIKTCADATDTDSVLWLRIGDATRIFEENGCVIIQGSDESDIIRAADRFVLTLIGVMLP